MAPHAEAAPCSAGPAHRMHSLSLTSQQRKQQGAREKGPHGCDGGGGKACMHQPREGTHPKLQPSRRCIAPYRASELSTARVLRTHGMPCISG